MSTGWVSCSWIIPPRRNAWLGGCAMRSSAKSGRRPGDGCARRGAAGARPGHGLGRRDGAPVAPFLRRWQPGWADRKPDRIHLGHGAGPGDARPAPSTPVLADWCGRLGQDLFSRPTSAGGPAGVLDHNPLALGRANFAAALVGGDSAGLSTSFDPIALAARHGQGRNPSFFAQLLLGADGPEVQLDAPGRPGIPSSACWVQPRSADLISHFRWR